MFLLFSGDWKPLLDYTVKLWQTYSLCDCMHRGVTSIPWWFGMNTCTISSLTRMNSSTHTTETRLSKHVHHYNHLYQSLQRVPLFSACLQVWNFLLPLDLCPLDTSYNTVCLRPRKSLMVHTLVLSNSPSSNERSNREIPCFQNDLERSDLTWLESWISLTDCDKNQTQRSTVKEMGWLAMKRGLWKEMMSDSFPPLNTKANSSSIQKHPSDCALSGFLVSLLRIPPTSAIEFFLIVSRFAWWRP